MVTRVGIQQLLDAHSIGRVQSTLPRCPSEMLLFISAALEVGSVKAAELENTEEGLF